MIRCISHRNQQFQCVGQIGVSARAETHDTYHRDAAANSMATAAQTKLSPEWQWTSLHNDERLLL
jgi:hypothetical protein